VTTTMICTGADMLKINDFFFFLVFFRENLTFSILELASFERARLECLSLKNCKSKSIYFFSTFFSGRRKYMIHFLRTIFLGVLSFTLM
jgi:hypothetical protein